LNERTAFVLKLSEFHLGCCWRKRDKACHFPFPWPKSLKPVPSRNTLMLRTLQHPAEINSAAMKLRQYVFYFRNVVTNQLYTTALVKTQKQVITWVFILPGKVQWKRCRMNFTFMRPCIVNVFKHNQQDATLHNGIYYYKCSTCFRRFLRPSSGVLNCIHSIGWVGTRGSNSPTIAVRSRKSSTNTRCCVYSFELLMMGGETAWNM